MHNAKLLDTEKYTGLTFGLTDIKFYSNELCNQLLSHHAREGKTHIIEVGIEVIDGVLSIEAKVNDGALLEDKDSVKKPECVWRRAMYCGNNCDSTLYQSLHH